MENNEFIPLPKRLEKIEDSLKVIAQYLLAKENGEGGDIEIAKTELEKIIK